MRRSSSAARDGSAVLHEGDVPLGVALFAHRSLAGADDRGSGTEGVKSEHERVCAQLGAVAVEECGHPAHASLLAPGEHEHHVGVLERLGTHRACQVKACCGAARIIRCAGDRPPAAHVRVDR
jgi:hypothetical protein